MNDILSKEEERKIFKGSEIFINFENFSSINEINAAINQLKPYVLEANGKFILQRSWYEDIKNKLEKNIFLLDKKIADTSYEEVDTRLNDNEHIIYLWDLVRRLEKDQLIEWISNDSDFHNFVNERLSGISSANFVVIEQDKEKAKDGIGRVLIGDLLFKNIQGLSNKIKKDILLPFLIEKKIIGGELFDFNNMNKDDFYMITQGMYTNSRMFERHLTWLKYNYKEGNFERWVFPEKDFSEELKEVMAGEDLVELLKNL